MFRCRFFGLNNIKKTDKRIVVMKIYLQFDNKLVQSAGKKDVPATQGIPWLYGK